MAPSWSQESIVKGIFAKMPERVLSTSNVLGEMSHLPVHKRRKDTISSVLSRLVAQGILERPKRGHYRLRRSAAD